MTHLEDSVLYGGVAGVKEAYNALRSLRDMLAGSSKSKSKVTVKWDGAPAVFAGVDPSDGKFFVAKKGIFNKNPMVYKTNKDIDADTSGDLNAKLKLALAELPKLGIKGVVQGDFLFSAGDVRSETIDDEKFITFHPNTIMYAVPEDSDLAKQITKAKMGIVWHTSYSGDSFENMKAKFGVDSNKFRKVSSVFSIDANLKDVSGSASMTKAETRMVDTELKNVSVTIKKVAGRFLNDLQKNKQMASLIEMYNNSKVREGTFIQDANKHVVGFQEWVLERHRKEIDKLKSEDGKKRKRDKQYEIEDWINSNRSNLKAAFELQKSLAQAKLKLIEKLNVINSMSTFLKTDSGFKVTGQEGFVAIDHISGGAYKVIDRLEFSKANFSPEIIKGWDSSRRG